MGAGDKVRTIALTPDLIVSRSTAKKLWAAAADQVARLEPGLQGLQLLNPDRNFACSFHRYCHLLSTPIESIEPRRNPGEDP